MTNIEVNRFRDLLERRRAELVSGNRSREALAEEMSADALDRIQGGLQSALWIAIPNSWVKLMRRLDAGEERLTAMKYLQPAMAPTD
jgi:hypothetical protein